MGTDQIYLQKIVDYEGLIPLNIFATQELTKSVKKKEAIIDFLVSQQPQLKIAKNKQLKIDFAGLGRLMK